MRRLSRRVSRSLNQNQNLLKVLFFIVAVPVVIALGAGIIMFASVFYLFSPGLIFAILTNKDAITSFWDLTAELLLGFSVYTAGGLIIALINRNREVGKMGEKGIAGIILSDYSFNESAALRLISLGYSVAQGALLGFAVSVFPCAIAATSHFEYIAYPVFHPASICLAGGLAVLALILIRLWLEGAALRIRARQSANSYFIEARKNLLGDPGDG